MSPYLLIDGYNLINKWSSLIKVKQKNIDSARSMLFDIVQAYCDYTGVNGVIVYDGSQHKRSIQKGNPTVIFSMKGESADTIIESLVYNLEDKNKTIVVTDDRAQRSMVCGMGVSVISVAMFKSEVEKVLKDFKR